MLDVGSTFERLLGRQPSEKEIQKLYRVKNALNIHDNDALWLVLMALESYDTMFQKYPSMISRELVETVDELRAVMAEIAKTETQKALGALADAVSKSSKDIALRHAEASRFGSWGWAWFGFTVFGALCVCLGVVLGTGRLPVWTTPGPGEGPVMIIMSSIARAPAGLIASIGATAASIAALWRTRKDIMEGRRLWLLAGSVLLLILSAGVFWATF